MAQGANIDFKEEHEMAMKNKRTLALALAGASALTMLAACGGSPASESAGGSSNASGSAAGEPVTLTFWRAGTDVETETYWNEMIDRFEAEHPGVTVELSSLPWGDEIETKLNAAYASGTAPDILNYSLVSIPQRASVGQYANLDSYIANWDGAEDIMPAVMETGKYDGSVYGIPIKPDARVFAWRKDMFEAAGLDPETPPSTWEELKEFADKLTIKENGVTVQAGYNMSIANGFQDFQIFLMQNGGDFVDVDTNTLTYNSPEAVEALEFLNTFVQDGNVIPADQFQSGSDVFIGGKAAMGYKNPADIQNMITADPTLADKIGVGAPLSRKEQATFGGMGFMFMSEDSKNKDLAWEFIEMSMNNDEMSNRMNDLGIPPVRQSLVEDFVALNPEMNQAIVDAIAVGRAAYPVTYSNDLNEHVSDAIEQVYYGKKSAQEALDESVAAYQKEVDALLAS